MQPDTWDDTGQLGDAFALLERQVAAGDTAGAALAVARDGALLAVACAGAARPGQPATAATLWPLASISKLYTAAAAMSLVERGELTLSTPVAMVLPDFTGGDKERVTVWHLLTHTSGLIYEAPEMAQLLERQTPLDAIVDEVYERPLLFAPGTRHSYTDLGFALLGRVAATVAGQPFPELVRKRVLEPAGLQATGCPPRLDESERIAHVAGSLAYGTDGAMYNSPYALQLAHPAFGVVASVADLARFGLCFAPGGPRFLAEATVRAMTHNQLGPWVTAWDPQTVEQPCWGLGFSVRGPHGPSAGYGDLLPESSFGHGGASGCALLIDPRDGLVIAIVGNRHASFGRARFTRRLNSLANVVLACLTR
jgi:CubicO group peptidase (beta-lactamase class C family)